MMKFLISTFCLISTLRHVHTATLSDIPTALLWRVADVTSDTCQLIVANRDFERRMRLSEPAHYEACKMHLIYPELEEVLLFVTRQCLLETLSALYHFHGLSPDSDACVDLLGEAAGADCFSVVDFLIDQGTDINGDLGLMTAVEVAATENNAAMFDHLVSKGAEVDFSDVLCAAIEADHLSMVRHVIDIAIAQSITVDLEQVFTLAGSRGNVEILRYLSSIPEPLETDLLNGAALSASREGQADAVLFLCELGASKNLALEAAALKGHTEFLARVIDLSRPGEDLSSTILYNAVVNGHYDSVKLLAPHFDAETRAEAMIYAFQKLGESEDHEDPDIFCFLLNSPGILFDTYMQAYMTAARHGKLKILELFLSEGARTACLQRNKYENHFATFGNLDVDLHGGAAISIASDYSHYDAVKYLMEKGSSYLNIGLVAAVEAFDLEYARVLADRINNPAFLENYFQIQVLHGKTRAVVACLSLDVRHDIGATIVNAIASRNGRMFRLFKNGVQLSMVSFYALAAFRSGNYYAAHWLSRRKDFDEHELMQFLMQAIYSGNVKTIALALDMNASAEDAYITLLSGRYIRLVSILLAAIGRSKLTGQDCVTATINAFQATQVPEEDFLQLLPVFTQCHMESKSLHAIAGKFSYFGFIRQQVQRGANLVADGCYLGVLESIGAHLPYAKALVRAGCSIKQPIDVGAFGSFYANIPLKHAILLYSLPGRSLEPVKWALSPEINANLRFGADIAIKTACRINFVDGFKVLLSEGKFTLEELNQMKILSSAVTGDSLEIVRILLAMNISTNYQDYLPLRYALHNHNMPMFAELVGASDAGDKLGQTGERMLGNALTSRNFELAGILLDGGVMPTALSFKYCIDYNLADLYCLMVMYKPSLNPKFDDACRKQDWDLWKREAKLSRR